MNKDEKLLAVIEPIQDPELLMSIVELGLIYRVEWVEDTIQCDMTFTSPACPVGPQLKAFVEQALNTVEGAKKVEVNVVWSPPWNPKEHCSEDAKMKLGIF